MFPPSYILARASYISFGSFLDDTWGIKWSLIESTIILIALTRSFLCFSFASSSSGSTTSSLMYLATSFSSRMRPILYFHAQKFYIPSRLSSSLVLGAILSRRSLKNWNFSKCKTNLTKRCTWLRWVGWSTWFLEIPNLHPSKLACEISVSIDLWLWFSAVFSFKEKLRFGFPGYPPTQKLWSRSQ